MLPEIVQACRGSKVEVYFDGGIRTGTDVFKALAIGARAVFIGRPILYGLAYQASVIVSPWLQSSRTKREYSFYQCIGRKRC